MAPPGSIVNENLTADGPTSEIIWRGGPGTFAGTGTFGGGTLTMEVSYDAGTTWVAAGVETTLTADGHANFDLPQGVLVRGNLVGSTAPDIDVNCLGRDKNR